MKNLIFTLVIFIVGSFSLNAQSNSSNLFTYPNTVKNTYQYKDLYGNSYKSNENLWKDSDNDGYSNYYDRHDKNPNIGISKTPTYSNPSYYNNYKSSSYDYESGRTIYEGSRGGKYYINSNGNKTYIKKKSPYEW